MDHTSSSTATVADDSRTRDERSRNDVDISMNVLRQAASLNRAANTLPRLGETYELCMSYGVFSEYMAVSRERILSLTQKLFSAGGVRMRMPRDLTDLSGLIDRVVDGNDIISERAGILIDEIAKTHRREAVSVPKAISQAECTTRSVDACNPGSTHGQVLSVPLRTGGPQSIAQLARLRAISRHKEIISKVVAIKKPQIEYGFSSYVNNTHDAFTPKLTRKHNALDRQAPSGIAIVDEVSSYTQPWLSDEAENVHPYATELLHFSVPLHQTKSSPVLVYKSLEDTPLKFVNTKEDLEELRKYLTSVDEFSVDIEHHDYRSFLGFCCLLQISTRDKDFIVDPFPIWEHVSLLNEPFTDPKILKVFHGADKDILWLQRDFGIYVVNMFDTGRAMRHLGMPKLSLQFLVDNFCGVQLNKQYQTTDWRVRPLSNEMLHYAREDTHYLLYCYDKLREQLIAAGNSDTNNLLKAVYADSKDLCSKVFEKPLFDPIGFSAFIASKRSFNNRQMFALRELWRWRDETARSEDESLAYVLPSHMMLHIAESLPRDMQGILACCSPVPTPVKEHLLILHRIVLEARDRPLERLATNLGGSAQEADGNLSVLAKARRAKNKLDHLTGRLLTALDIHFNEEDHEILKKIAHTCDNQELDFKELKNTHLCVLYHVPVAASSVSSRDVNLSSQSRASGVRSRFAAMASPYECFLLAVKEREKRQEAERKTQLDKPTEVVTEKRYSHHDPTVCRKPIFDEETRNSDDIAVTGMEGEGASNANSLFEEQTLTKKGLKRKMKESRDAADLKLESQAKSVKKEEAVEPPVPVVNYAAFDPQMFEHQPRGSHSYNPFGRGRAPGRGRGNRGGGRGARGHQGQGRGGRGRSSFR